VLGLLNSDQEHATHAFSGLDVFVNAAKNLVSDVEKTVQDSAKILKSGDDPISLKLTDNRRLDNLEENSYSDWLAWVLQVACAGTRHSSRLIDDLFGHSLNAVASESDSGEESGPPLIVREIQVERGHEGKAGRLDILVDFSDLKCPIVWHIEVKTTSAEAADIDKHQGYASSLNGRYGDIVRHILLVTSARKESYPTANGEAAFSTLTWEELSRRMRHRVSRSSRFELKEAMMLFMCALIEQKLIGIRPNSLEQFWYLKECLGE
jgi:hypothetical protein